MKTSDQNVFLILQSFIILVCLKTHLIVALKHTSKAFKIDRRHFIDLKFQALTERSHIGILFMLFRVLLKQFALKFNWLLFRNKPARHAKLILLILLIYKFWRWHENIRSECFFILQSLIILVCLKTHVIVAFKHTSKAFKIVHAHFLI